MSSKNKTALGLSQWEGTDVPQRLDFNSDNLLTDWALMERVKKVENATPGNFAALTSDGAIQDSGKNTAYFETEIANKTNLFTMLDSFAPVEMRRTTFRGKNLGASVTAEQKTNIKNGSFKGLFLGDYWVTSGKTWRIADFNYWINCGDNAVPPSHLVIMPDEALYSAQMNETNITNGGYVGSKMYREGLIQAKTMIASAFPGMVLNHRELLVNAVTSGYPSGVAWYDSMVELPNEIMMYGSYIHTPSGNGTTIIQRSTIDNFQLALMAAYPRFIKTGEIYWLRDVMSESNFSHANHRGTASYVGAADNGGVRPVFGIG